MLGENFLPTAVLLVALEVGLWVPCGLKWFVSFGTSKWGESWGSLFWHAPICPYLVTAASLLLPPALLWLYTHLLPCVGLLKMLCLVVSDVAVPWLHIDVPHLCIAFWVCCRRHPRWETSTCLAIWAFKCVWISGYSSLKKHIICTSHRGAGTIRWNEICIILLSIIPCCLKCGVLPTVIILSCTILMTGCLPCAWVQFAHPELWNRWTDVASKWLQLCRCLLQLRMTELIFDLTGNEHFAPDTLGNFSFGPCSRSAPRCSWNMDLEPFCWEIRTLHTLRQVSQSELDQN